MAAEYYLLTFLPQSHPQTYLPMLFRMWEAVNSYNYDERMLNFLAQLAEMHVDPSVSDPKRIETLPDDAVSEDEGRPNWPKDDLNYNGSWNGIYKDVGIFSEDEWSLIMVKCLASMGSSGLPVFRFDVWIYESNFVCRNTVGGHWVVNDRTFGG